MEEGEHVNLLDSIMETCTILDRVSVSDNVLGFNSAWHPGATFQAAIIKSSTVEARLAEKLGVTEVYTVATAKGFGLSYHDVFRRESDGQIFRVTGNQKDSEAPEASTVKIGKVSAERWELPS